MRVGVMLGVALLLAGCWGGADDGAPAGNGIAAGALPITTPGPAPGPSPSETPTPDSFNESMADDSAVADSAAEPAARPMPSFDCAAKLSSNEAIICGDPALANLDRQLGTLYAARRDAAAGAARTAIVDGQRAFLKTRNACKDVACIAAAYTARLGALEL